MGYVGADGFATNVSVVDMIPITEQSLITRPDVGAAYGHLRARVTLEFRHTLHTMPRGWLSFRAKRCLFSIYPRRRCPFPAAIVSGGVI